MFEEIEDPQLEELRKLEHQISEIAGLIRKKHMLNPEDKDEKAVISKLEVQIDTAISDAKVSVQESAL